MGSFHPKVQKCHSKRFNRKNVKRRSTSFRGQIVPWVWEGTLSVSVTCKSGVRYNESSWRPGKNTEDTIQMLQVWSDGRKGVKGSQNWCHLVCHRGREVVKRW